MSAGWAGIMPRSSFVLSYICKFKITANFVASGSLFSINPVTVIPESFDESFEMLTSVTAIPVRPLSYIHDTDLELELELVLLVDETPSTPVNSKLVAKINAITGKMRIIIFLDFIYFLQVLAGSYYPFLVILPLCKALVILNSHITIQSMRIEQILLQEIEESKKWFNIEKDDSTYKRDLAKRIELINLVLGNTKNTEIQICDHIETKMN